MGKIHSYPQLFHFLISRYGNFKTTLHTEKTNTNMQNIKKPFMFAYNWNFSEKKYIFQSSKGELYTLLVTESHNITSISNSYAFVTTVAYKLKEWGQNRHELVHKQIRLWVDIHTWGVHSHVPNYKGSKWNFPFTLITSCVTLSHALLFFFLFLRKPQLDSGCLLPIMRILTPHWGYNLWVERERS